MQTKSTKATTVVLSQDDINNPLHPNMWRELCEQLGYEADRSGDYPSELHLTVRGSEAQY